MADKITDAKILGIGFEYIDPDENKTKTTYLKVPNPRNNLTEQQIKTAALNLISGENPILHTTYGGDFDTTTAIATAYTESTRTVEYDIGIE